MTASSFQVKRRGYNLVVLLTNSMPTNGNHSVILEDLQQCRTDGFVYAFFEINDLILD